MPLRDDGGRLLLVPHPGFEPSSPSGERVPLGLAGCIDDDVVFRLQDDEEEDAVDMVVSDTSLRMLLLLQSSLECRISHSFFSLGIGLLLHVELVLRAGLMALSGSLGPFSVL